MSSSKCFQALQEIAPNIDGASLCRTFVNPITIHEHLLTPITIHERLLTPITIHERLLTPFIIHEHLLPPLQFMNAC